VVRARKVDNAVRTRKRRSNARGRSARTRAGVPRHRDRSPIRWKERRYPELREYLDELAAEADIDVSDLWDMYYGYAPGNAGEL
jgi:hypothetical protein